MPPVGQRTAYAPGTFCWVDLAASDAEAASAFYCAVLGWEADPAGPPEMGGYRMMRVEGREVCGLYAALAPGPPAWTSYIAVEDADAIWANALTLGASAVTEPMDVPVHGRLAVLRDPQGAQVALWQANAHIGAALVNDPGALSLNQLNTPDPERAIDFYSLLFGWEISVVVDDEPRYWGIRNADALNGGMMALPPGSPAPPHWLPYFTVEDIDAADALIVDAGGSVVVEVMPAGPGRILVAIDPQGAAFALYEGIVDP